MFISVYNLFYTSLPVLSIGIFDQDCNDDYSIRYPKLYAPGHLNLLFNKKEFFKSALHGFVTSCVIFLVPYGMIIIIIGNVHYVNSVFGKPSIVISINRYLPSCHIWRWTRYFRSHAFRKCGLHNSSHSCYGTGIFPSSLKSLSLCKKL